MNIIKKTLLAASVLATFQASALTINLTYDAAEFGPGVTNGAEALAGFQEAAAFWEGIFLDDVTVNLNISFDTLGAGILGGASSNYGLYAYQDVAFAMFGDETSTFDATANASLPCDLSQDSTPVFGVPGVCALQFLDDEGGVSGLDNDGSVDNFALAITQANAKALGFTDGGFAGGYNGIDGSITFSNTFNFDFDLSDGFDAGAFDFVGVAVHEIGHTLGFVSGVDTYDVFGSPSSPNYDPNFDLDGFVVASSLDLFRYSAESVAQGFGVLDFRPGADAYFSLDNGTNNLAPFAEGSFHPDGDGRQASHFKDNLGLGIMDPTFAPEEVGMASIMDVVAFDVIGWDVAAFQTPVPEPTTIALFGLGALGLAARRKKHA